MSPERTGLASTCRFAICSFREGERARRSPLQCRRRRGRGEIHDLGSNKQLSPCPQGAQNSPRTQQVLREGSASGYQGSASRGGVWLCWGAENQNLTSEVAGEKSVWGGGGMGG